MTVDARADEGEESREAIAAPCDTPPVLSPTEYDLDAVPIVAALVDDGPAPQFPA
jgi:hypothetical protein